LNATKVSPSYPNPQPSPGLHVYCPVRSQHVTEIVPGLVSRGDKRHPLSRETNSKKKIDLSQLNQVKTLPEFAVKDLGGNDAVRDTAGVTLRGQMQDVSSEPDGKRPKSYPRTLTVKWPRWMFRGYGLRPHPP
jgi:hypothetical protein